MLFRVCEKWELRAADDPTSSHHNTDRADLEGQRGFDPLDRRKALEKQFTACLRHTCESRQALSSQMLGK